MDQEKHGIPAIITSAEKRDFFREAVLAAYMKKEAGSMEKRVQESVTEATFLVAFVDSYNLDASINMAKARLERFFGDPPAANPSEETRETLGPDPTVLGSPEDYQPFPETEGVDELESTILPGVKTELVEGEVTKGVIFDEIKKEIGERRPEDHVEDYRDERG